MKTIAFLVVFSSILGCRTSKTTPDLKSNSSTDQTHIVPAILGYSKLESDSLQPVIIRSATITENVLTIEVNFSGGCEKHLFSLEGSTTIAKSMPAVRGIRLVHQGKKDLCEAMVIQTLTFDISALAYKQEKGSEIYLQLEGYDGEKMLYTYSVSK